MLPYHYQVLVEWGQLLFIVLLIVSIFVWFFMRKSKNTKRRNIVLISLGILLFLILSGTLLLDNYDSLIRVKREIIPEVPSSAKQLADEYIISKVGEQYFRENFVFDKQESIRIGGKNDSYSVTYRFSPLNQYNPTISVSVIVRDGKTSEASSGTLKQIPNCLQDASLCQFNLTSAEFGELARKHTLVGLEIEPPYIRRYACPERFDGTGTEFLIDYRTGQIVSIQRVSTAYPCYPEPVIERRGK